MFSKFLTMQLLCKSVYRFYAPFLYTEVISIEKGCFYMRQILSVVFVLLILCTFAACNHDPAEKLYHSADDLHYEKPTGAVPSNDIQGTLKIGDSLEEPTILCFFLENASQGRDAFSVLSCILVSFLLRTSNMPHRSQNVPMGHIS